MALGSDTSRQNSDEPDLEKLLFLLQQDLQKPPEVTPQALETSRAEMKVKIDNTLREKVARAEKLQRGISEILGEYSFDVMDPCGNTTCLISVTEERLSRDRETLVKKATEIVNKGLVEQVGFYIETPDDQAIDAKLEMAGGEFCLNATMSLATLLHKRAIPTPSRPLCIQCSGNDDPVECTCTYVGQENTPHIKAKFAALPIPRALENGLVTVRLPGITHILRPNQTENEFPDEGEDKLTLQSLLDQYPHEFEDAMAVGLIQYVRDNHGFVIQPTVFVRATKTMVSEKACASGTAAVTFFTGEESLAVSESTGVEAQNHWMVRQPSDGWITVQFKEKKGEHPTPALFLEIDIYHSCGSTKK